MDEDRSFSWLVKTVDQVIIFVDIVIIVVGATLLLVWIFFINNTYILIGGAVLVAFGLFRLRSSWLYLFG